MAPASAPLVGVGIDHEPIRAIDPAVARFYLQPHEMNLDPEIVLRLWTVKEALFKATPDNAAVTFLNFRLDDPHAWCGLARNQVRPELVYRYSTTRGTGHFMTLATAEIGEVR